MLIAPRTPDYPTYTIKCIHLRVLQDASASANANVGADQRTEARDRRGRYTRIKLLTVGDGVL